MGNPCGCPDLSYGFCDESWFSVQRREAGRRVLPPIGIPWGRSLRVLMGHPLPSDDLDFLFEQCRGLWEELRGCRILFTGASGFFGSWMLESCLHAGTRLNLPFRAIALTRNAGRFSHQLPHLAGDSRVEILEADVRNFPVPEGPVDYVVHSLVPDAGTSLMEMAEFFPSATRQLLAIALEKKSKAFLLCSTGAVYQPGSPSAAFSEGDPLVPLDGPLSYGQIRRKVEDQCRDVLATGDVALKVARGFAFVGPRLPLDARFAVGNFVRDALAGGPIRVKGDGSPIRSYLYASDMTAWLWTILLRGPSGGVFNVGSEEAVSIGDLAREVAGLSGVEVSIEGRAMPGMAPSGYIPATKLAESSLGLRRFTDLRQAIAKTMRFSAMECGGEPAGSMLAPSGF